MNNSIAALVWSEQHHVDWSAARVRSFEQHPWKRRLLKAILIKRAQNCLNLDCVLSLNQAWSPLLDYSLTQ